MNEVREWLSVVQAIGVSGLLYLILWGGLREKPWWVFGVHHREAVRLATERGDEYKADLKKTQDMLEEMISVCDAVVGNNGARWRRP